MFSFFQKNRIGAPELLISGLYSNDTFYKEFARDLNRCRSEVIIESPFIARKRINMLMPLIQKARKRGVRVIVNTRDPREHGSPFNAYAIDALVELEEMGARVFFTGGHHRKLAIFDRAILWEGSLNILSQNDSCEIMRRTHSLELAAQMIKFIKLDKLLQ